MKRSIRIANCSGAIPDPGYQMYRQAISGPVDAITGDYLAEMNLATNAKAYRQGEHPGWEPSAEDGIMLTLEAAAEKRIKIVVNGGSLNPSGLAKKVSAAVHEKGLDLKVAYVSGDDVFDHVDSYLEDLTKHSHLDSQNPHVSMNKLLVDDFLKDPKSREVVSANGYLGARSIRAAMDQLEADIVICGRVSDASPVIGLSAWWHNWSEQDFDQLAGSLVAGHLIECSAYTTGSNFSDFERYDQDLLIDVGLPIAEVADDGSFIITKHESLNGIVNVDTCKCQFLYELQGNIYLNSDVKADITNIEIEQAGENRVLIKGIKGHPPPPTTKLAIFYVGGYQSEINFNATGTPRNVRNKFELLKRQIRKGIDDLGITNKLDVLEFQVYAPPAENPSRQEVGTSFMRVFAQAKEKVTLGLLFRAMMNYFMQHYSGFHMTSDTRTAMPKEYVAFYPSVVPQTEFKEKCHLIDKEGADINVVSVPPVAVTEPLKPREDYDASPSTTDFGETALEPLETVVLGRSGDKGANVNLGLFVHQDDEYEWLKSYITKEKLKELIGEDWKEHYYIERVEFPQIKAVHFVVYGILGRGTSSSSLLDSLGKGFCDYIRSKYIDIPKKFVGRYQGKVYKTNKL